MRTLTAFRWLLALSTLFTSLATAQVRISEIHYDNVGTDSGEAVEVSAPAGTDLTGWSVVLYNGVNGQSYDTDALSGVVAASCGDRGVVVLNYPANGIQNGSPDAIALVHGSSVVDFLSYEGTFAATNGPAIGLTSVDIGASQTGSGPVGETLQRNAAGVWALASSTFGACNDGDETPAGPEVAAIEIAPLSSSVAVGGSVTLIATAFDANGAVIPGTPFTWSVDAPSVADVDANGVVHGLAAGTVMVTATSANWSSASATITVFNVSTPAGDFHFNEIHYDNVGADTGEAIEIEGPAGADLTGFSIVLYNGGNGAAYNTRPLSGTLPASCTNRGVLAVSYPADGIQNGAPDGMALVDASGEVIEFLSYEGELTATSGPAAGLVSTDIGAAQSSAPVGTSLSRGEGNTWNLGASSFGACNGTTTPVGNSIQFTGRTPSDVALPVGFEDQLFARLVSPSSTTVPSAFTWEALTPDVATIDARGVIHGVAAGSATFRATAATDGTTDTWTLPVTVAIPSATAQYANNTEFGEPLDSDPTDDWIIERPQYTSSWNPNRGSPNWVSYELEATHFGAEDRCDCFTMDAELPSSLTRLTTADYTDAGAFHSYGIDRGHLARSFDRTSGSLDNATTFYLSNIVPQASDQNQGPWAQLENYLGDFARLQDREVYVIAGVAGNKGTLKNEGKIVIPTHTWKVALIVPRDHGLADVHDYRDVQVVAVIMPNEPGVRNVPWQTYQTTVDAVEALSGYDLLALLEDGTEAAVESGTQPPIASVTAPASSLEGDAVPFNATGSVDPNGSVTGYAWDFGDGATGEGISVTHVYAQDGVYTARLTVTDNDGLTGSEVITVTVANVAPVVAAVPDATLNAGATYTVNGTFTDPGADAWTATVIWGDGSAPEQVPVGAGGSRGFTLTHVYTAGGSYPVTIRVADDDAAGEDTHTVTVNEAAPGLSAALPLIDDLVARRKISRPIGILLKAQVIAAQVMIGRGNQAGGRIIVRSLLVQLEILVRYGGLSPADVAPLRSVLTASL
ncbi:MAG TPA: DNA/RNA non-specific endonuclease [Steroidobacteraceae bacterium]|nr:DNA/RNA non-specific endonuclease [Steroidobacteraceae bacterium]